MAKDARTRRVHAAREALGRVERELKRLAKARDREGAQADEWERLAMMSVRANRDDLARDALERKRAHGRLRAGLAREHELCAQVLAVLREQLSVAESET